MDTILILSFFLSFAFLLRARCVPARGLQNDPGAWFEALRDHPEWSDSKRDEVFDQLLRRFTADQLIATARERLTALDDKDGEAVLRIIEAFGAPEDFEALARAIIGQPNLSAERAWEALTLLEGSGLIEQEPVLAERWEELVDLVEGDDPLVDLAEQIEEPDGVWVSLQGLGAVEPDLRATIIAGLAKKALARPGLLKFLRYLTFADHPATREAALQALDSLEATTPASIEAWTTIASRHPDPAIASRARRWLTRHASAETQEGLPQRLEIPRIIQSLVSEVDGQGRAEILLIAEEGDQLASLAIGCDLEVGIQEAFGEIVSDEDSARAFLDGFLEASPRPITEVEPGLALSLLAGCWMLSGPKSPPALSFWIERTAGPIFRPRPFVARIVEEIPAILSPAETERCARLVLDACPSWADDSPLTFNLAEEAILQTSSSNPDPGAIRFLFERRLRDRLERYRRMLLWMAILWRAEGADELSRSALALVYQLDDPQHAVPGHPFLSSLAERSLLAARKSLQAGQDPRRMTLANPDRNSGEPGGSFGSSSSFEGWSE